MLSRLTPAHLEVFLTDLERDGVTPSLRRAVFQVLNRALKQALAWNLIVRNPATAVVRPRVPRKEMRTLTPDQARLFLEMAKEDRYHALYAAAARLWVTPGRSVGPHVAGRGSHRRSPARAQATL